jgi:hypothetical protein
MLPTEKEVWWASDPGLTPPFLCIVQNCSVNLKGRDYQDCIDGRITIR